MSDSDRPSPDFRALFEAAPTPMLVLTPGFEITAVNEAYLRATMTKRGEILGRHIFEVFPDNPEDPAATGVSNLRASLERALASRRPDSMPVQKYDIRRPEGGGFEERYWSPLNTPVLDPATGEVAWIIHRVEDVTELVRLQVEGAARDRLASDQRTVIERLRDANAAHAAEAEERRRAEAALKALNATLEQRVADEVRNREAAQAQLAQAQKMEAVGQLTGGIAHDMNNVLQAVLGNLDLAETGLPDGAARQRIGGARRAAERGARLIGQLLAFSRKQDLRLQPIDLNALVGNMQDMLERSLSPAIQIIHSLQPGLWPAMADPTQLEVALLNLAINARDAMPLGGTLRIETRSATAGEIGRPAELLGDAVALAVSDNGAGMSPEIAARCVEPFFTTKDVGKGSGLGLSQVYGMVKQLGGAVSIDSTEGRGTTVTLYLPRAPAAASALEITAANATPASMPEAPEPYRHLLLVDDDADVREVMAAMLQAAGYDVVKVDDGPAALAILRQDKPVDLLITDLAMPMMRGSDLAAAAEILRPGLPVLLITGDREAADTDGGAVLRKPFRPAELVARVRECLTANADGIDAPTAGSVRPPAAGT